MAATPYLALTGSRGWIGGQVLEDLRRRNIDVVCLHHDSPPAEVSAICARADVVIHAGGVTSRQRGDCIDGNIEQALHVAKGCSKAHNVLLYLSSVKVYGWAWPLNSVCDEGHPARGAYLFGRAKRLVEELFGLAAETTFLFRLSNVYGRGIPPKYLLGKMLETTHAEGKVVLDCTGQSRRDFVHLEDVVQVIGNVATAALKKSLPTGGQAFNVVSGRLLTMIEVAEIYRDVLGARLEVRSGPALSSPSYANERIRKAGYLSSFRDPAVGIREFLEAWSNEPCERS